MLRLCLLMIFALMLAPLAAQEGAEDKPSDQPERATSLELPEDFGPYIRRVLPGVDPAGEHDFYNLKNYSDPDQLHEYTVLMARLAMLYIDRLEMGGTLAMLFDQYSRGREAAYPVYHVLHALVLQNHPPVNPNISEAERLLRECAERHPTYAFPWFALAQLPGDQGRDRGPVERMRTIERALELRPRFLQASILKAEILINARAPVTEAIAVLEPLVNGPLPQDAQLYHRMMTLYAIAAGSSSMLAAVDKHMQLESLDRAFVWRGNFLRAVAHMSESRWDDAIGSLQATAAKLEAAREPEDVIVILESLAECWRQKARALQRTQPEERARAQEMLEEARRLLLKAVETEREHLPRALHGGRAEQYVRFLVSELNRLEDAANWLVQYLDEADLPASRRSMLETRLAQIMLRVSPTERNRIELLESQLRRDDARELERALAQARAELRRGERFQSNRAVQLFNQLLRHRTRQIVRDAAFLAADTALNIGGDAIPSTAAAIAERFLEETECNSTEQRDLQSDLGHSLRRLNDRAALARVLRHQAKLVEETNDPASARGVVLGWNTPEWLRTLNDGPGSLPRMHYNNPAQAADWLRKQAHSIERELEPEPQE